MTKEEDIPGVVDEQLLYLSYCRAVFQYFKCTEGYERGNKIFDQAYQELERTFQNLTQHLNRTSIEISFAGEQVYVEQARVRPKPRQFYIFWFLTRFSRERNVGTIIVREPLHREQLEAAFWAISQVGRENSEKFEFIQETLKQENIDTVVIKPAFKLHDTSENLDDLEDAERVIVALYEQMRRHVDIVYDNLEHSTKFDLGNIKTYIQDLIQLDNEDVVYMLRVLGLKRYDKPMAYLSVNTGLVMMAWAQWLQLPPGVIAELTEAALLHPLVYLAQDEEEMFQLDYSEEQLNKVWSLQERLKSVWSINSLQRLVSVEWGISFGADGTYEVGGVKTYAHVFSRMLRIVATYERYTTYIKGKKNYLPDEAMRELLKVSHQFDPTLIKLFVNWMGIYPVGSFVELQTGEVAQVYAGSSDPLRFQRPVVCVLKDAQGNLLDRPHLLDLTSMNERLGVYRRSIKKSLTPEEADIPENTLNIAPREISV